jgi:probable F420-dependent oxidoreductase
VVVAASTSLAVDRLRFGIQTRALREQVVALERLGFDSLWCGGHVASPNGTPEAMMQLARLSALTERVTVGTAILTLPLYQPAVIAKQIADLDCDTGGRLLLGIGVGGEYAQEFRACEVSLEGRGTRTDEAVAVLRRLWTAEEVTHAGRHFSLDRVRITPAPVQPGGPPIIVAGRRKAAMSRAALLGDGWMPYLYSAKRYADSVGTVLDLATAAGRDLSQFHWMAYVFINVDRNSARARADTVAFLGGNYKQEFDNMVDRVAVAGTSDEVVGKLQAFVDAGARHLIFAPARRTGVVELAATLVAEVLPRLRVRAEAGG